MMGMASLNLIVAGLVRAGLSSTTPAAIIQNGFADDERRVAGTLASLPELVGRHRLGSPAVVVIGDVVGLADSLLVTPDTIGSVPPPGPTSSTQPVGTA